MKTNEIFNEIRMAYQGQVLTTKEVLILLSDIPNSKNNLFLTMLVEHKAINRVGKGQYTFPSTPIHYSVLEQVFSDIRERQNGYNKKYMNKKKENKSEIRSDIQKAIDLLLSTGEYEIFRIEKIVSIKKVQL